MKQFGTVNDIECRWSKTERITEEEDATMTNETRLRINDKYAYIVVNSS